MQVFFCKKKPPAKAVAELIVLAGLLERSQVDLNQRYRQ